MSAFRSTVATWTSFNRLHKENNLKCVDWALGFLNELGEEDILVDFGCGTGETAAHIGSLHKFGPCQVVGLDINLQFIQHATSRYRHINNVSYFWSLYMEDLRFLKQKTTLITCFSTLHILPQVQLNQVLTFFKDILVERGKVVVLHYLGRTDQCFQIFLEIYLHLKNRKKWAPYLNRFDGRNFGHKTLEKLHSEMVKSRQDLVTSFKKEGFTLLQQQELASNVIINPNNMATIMDHKSIRRMEFGSAYDDIPPELHQEFAADFCGLLKSFYLKSNSQFIMAVFEKQ